MRHLGTVVLDCPVCGTTQHFISEHQMPERVWAFTCLDCLHMGYLPESRWSQGSGMNNVIDLPFYVVQEERLAECTQCDALKKDILHISDSRHAVTLDRCQACGYVELEESCALSNR